MPILALIGPYFLRALPYLIAVGAIAGSYFYAYEKGKTAEHAQVVAVQAEFDAYRAKEAAIVAGLASAWDQKRQAAELSAQQLETERAERFSSLQERARVLSTGGASAGGHLRLYDDAARAAAAIAPTAPDSDKALAPPSNSTEEYIVDLYAWAGECRDRVSEWAEFYESLRSQH